MKSSIITIIITATWNIAINFEHNVQRYANMRVMWNESSLGVESNSNYSCLSFKWKQFNGYDGTSTTVSMIWPNIFLY